MGELVSFREISTQLPAEQQSFDQQTILTSKQCPRQICNGSGWVETVRPETSQRGQTQRVARMGRCRCLTEATRQQRLERLVKAELFPAEYAPMTFESFDPSLAPLQFAAARSYADRFLAGEVGHSLILYGAGKGQGKSHLTAAIANSIARAGVELLFILMADLWARIFDSRQDQSELIAACQRVPVLFLDDVGLEEHDEPPWKRAEKKQRLFQIVNRRSMSQSPIILTSNLGSLGEFGDVLGDATMSRLLGMATPAGLVSFSGVADHRLVGFRP